MNTPTPSPEDRELLLHDRGIFDIDAYGWLPNEDVDEEFAGYAGWWADPPHEYAFDFWCDEAPAPLPTDAAQRLMELGFDFMGLMKTARHFIGFALAHRYSVPPIRIDATDFDFHEFAALFALVAANDRLRDFLIVATLGRKSEDRTQLEQAYAVLDDGGLAAAGAKLREFARLAEVIRKPRNRVTHGLATRAAVVQRRLRDRDRKAHTTSPRMPAPDENPVAFFAQTATDEAAELAEVSGRVDLLCTGYIALVRLGNGAFDIENRLRSRKPTQGQVRGGANRLR